MRTFELLILSAVAVVIKTKKSDNSVKEACTETSLPTAINTFSLELYKKLAAKNQGRDVFFSPFSITSAIALLLLGADENTKEEIEEVLHVAGIESDDLHSMMSCLYNNLQDGDILKMANRLYPNTTLELKQDYINKIQKYYGVTLESLNFKNVEPSRKAINKWVEKQTNGQIKEMLKSGDIDALTMNVLVNAIYFKGEWKEKFDAKKTKPYDFFLDETNSVKVDMMAASSKYKFEYSYEFQSHFLELPYNRNGHSDLSMVLIAPIDRTGLEELEAKLTIKKLQQTIKKMSLGNARLFLPKFKLNSRYDMSTVLEDLGMHDLFSSQNVDLSLLTDDPSIEVSKIIHEASVVVNEEGTKAVAATGVVMARTSPPAIMCDHPFIFIIRDIVSGTILFMGRLVHPEPSSASLQPPSPDRSRKIPFTRFQNPPSKLVKENVAYPTSENCRESCRKECRDKCFKKVQKQMNERNTDKARRVFNRNKDSRQFGYILIPYRKCRKDCRTPCMEKCKART